MVGFLNRPRHVAASVRYNVSSDWRLYRNTRELPCHRNDMSMEAWAWIRHWQRMRLHPESWHVLKSLHLSMVCKDQQTSRFNINQGHHALRFL